MSATKKFGETTYTYYDTYLTEAKAVAKVKEFRHDGLAARVQKTSEGYVVWYYGGPTYKAFGGKKYSLYGGYDTQHEAEKRVASLRRTLHSKDVIVVPGKTTFMVYYERSLRPALDRSIYRKIGRK